MVMNRYPLFFGALFAVGFSACTNSKVLGIADPGFFLLGPARFSVYWSDPGVSPETAVDKKIDAELVKLIDLAEKSVDLAVYNLGRQALITAMINANERGLKVRMVGDVDESPTKGYQDVLRYGKFTFSLGNADAIQHNKYAVVDDKFLFVGTGNFSDSDLDRNNNNYMIIESDTLTAEYKTEFEQMFFGRYGARKIPFTSNHNHMVNLTPLERYFSPYDGDLAMTRLIQLVDGAQREIQFMIFAFTHDELTSALIRAARRGVLVRGVHDYTFIRGTSEEAPRLYSAGIYMPTGPYNREDGNENTATPGVRSHGGKLHCKTMIIDGNIVATGSFNWSTNAIDNNDENMVVVYSPFVARELQNQWDSVWAVSRPITGQLSHSSGSTANPGDVVISEVMWAGSYEATSPSPTLDANDDWIELRNMTNRDIDVSHWVITWDQKELRHYPIPDEFNWFEASVATRHYALGRLVIPANGYFLLKNANGALNSSDNKISGTKEFSLNSASMIVRLYDLTMNLIDQAGDGSPPFAGKLDTFNQRTHSMERFFSGSTALPGSSPGSWYTSNGNNLAGASAQGTGQISETFRNGTIGTPNYSGNFSGTVAFPSTAGGGVNAYTNIPVEAFSTGTNSMTVRYRWALNSAPTFAQDVASTGCSATALGAVSATLDPSDKSRVLLTHATAQVAGTIYCVSPATGAVDASGGTSATGSSIAFTGFTSTQANLQIFRVYPSQSSSRDIIIMKALSGGRVFGMGLYLYDFSSRSPILIYRFRDFQIAAGDYIMVKLNFFCDTPCTSASTRSEDRNIVSAANNEASIRNQGASGPNGGNCQGLNCANVWELFGELPGISATDGILFVGASSDISTAAPTDLMCFSNRDGDIPTDLVLGGFRDVAKMTAVYNMNGVFPVDAFNDQDVQAACSLYTGTSGNYLERQVDTNSASDFVQK